MLKLEHKYRTSRKTIYIIFTPHSFAHVLKFVDKSYNEIFLIRFNFHIRNVQKVQL